MLYDDGDLSHEFADDEDARIERLENVKAAVEDVSFKNVKASTDLHVELDT